MKRFEVHSHTAYSNFRLLDCINKPENLIKRAIEIGLSGIAITDHETVAGHMEINLLAQSLQKDYPDFKIALGNEIYLTESREIGQKYFHFILIAKNKEGQRALRELSSKSWLNSYYDRGLERVPTLYNELEAIIHKYPNSLIATSACLGGELSSTTLDLCMAETCGNTEAANSAYNRIINFILWCKGLFGEDFYIECAPGKSKDQIIVNKRLKSIAQAFDIKMVIGSDAHYLTKKDRYIHKSYLNSKGGEREVDSFYEYAYLQTNEEEEDNLIVCFDKNFIESMWNNSMEIWNKIENYSLSHKQTIPKVEVKNYPKEDFNNIEDGDKFISKYPILASMHNSDDKIERYWVNECCNQLSFLGKYNDTYLSRLEEEAEVKKIIGEKLETNMFAYPVTLQHYVDLFWDCGSMVGAGRGSSCAALNHYLLGITQLDPIEWNLPFFRYLNKERTELGDIDLDLCPSKRPRILNEIKKERAENFIASIDEDSRKNLGCTLIATYGTESTKSTILTACRGYRSEEYPDGIDNDIAQYLSSLVPQERGFLWSLKDMIIGDPEKGRNPVSIFINEVNEYPGLLDIMIGIEGIVNKRSSHASGVILFDEDPYEFGCFMKTPKGEVITQYDLHMCEAAGMTKYDFLVTEVQDKLVETIHLLQEDNLIDKKLSLKEVYDKYFHPNVLPLNDNKCWEALQNGSVLNVFQFDSDVGSQAAKKIKPTNMLELADANGLMRLMTSEKGAETPMEKYIRYKNDITLWYKEMDKAGLTKTEQKILEPYFKKSYGVPPSQEQLMTMLMDENICGFTLAEANAARKIVGKKQMDKIPELRTKVLIQAKRKELGDYVWKYGIGPQMGYSFSIIHALAYSFIGFQTLYIATHWNPIYWNTACLIVNSGALESDNDEDTKEKATDYAKVAKALGEIIDKGIKVSLVDINKSDYGFKPDVENNQILFGMKALSNVGLPVIEMIKKNRPYKSIADFMNRCKISKTAMVSLIKSGAFDKVDSSWAKGLCSDIRFATMGYFISKASEPKKKLTLQNLPGLISKGIIDSDSEIAILFKINKHLKTKKNGDYYLIDDNIYSLIKDIFTDIDDNINIINGNMYISQKTWERLYKSKTETFKINTLKPKEKELLDKYNNALFSELWEKYASGNISAWEMEALCFYYHPHELSNVDEIKYGISNFKDLPTEPEIERYWKRGGRQIPIFVTHKIIGTVISKDDSHSSVSILTTTGVVRVKFTRDYYAMYAKQISEKLEDGTKKVREKGWFTRGTKIMVTGFRRDDFFQAKAYKNTPTHQLYKITNVDRFGNMDLVHDRWGME